MGPQKYRGAHGHNGAWEPQWGPVTTTGLGITFGKGPIGHKGARGPQGRLGNTKRSGDYKGAQGPQRAWGHNGTQRLHWGEGTTIWWGTTMGLGSTMGLVIIMGPHYKGPQWGPGN